MSNLRSSLAPRLPPPSAPTQILHCVYPATIVSVQCNLSPSPTSRASTAAAARPSSTTATREDLRPHELGYVCPCRKCNGRRYAGQPRKMTLSQMLDSGGFAPPPIEHEVFAVGAPPGRSRGRLHMHSPFAGFRIECRLSAQQQKKLAALQLNKKPRLLSAPEPDGSALVALSPYTFYRLHSEGAGGNAYHHLVISRAGTPDTTPLHLLRERFVYLADWCKRTGRASAAAVGVHPASCKACKKARRALTLLSQAPSPTDQVDDDGDQLMSQQQDEEDEKKSEESEEEKEEEEEEEEKKDVEEDEEEEEKEKEKDEGRREGQQEDEHSSDSGTGGGSTTEAEAEGLVEEKVDGSAPQIVYCPSSGECCSYRLPVPQGRHRAFIREELRRHLMSPEHGMSARTAGALITWHHPQLGASSLHDHQQAPSEAHNARAQARGAARVIAWKELEELRASDPSQGEALKAVFFDQWCSFFIHRLHRHFIGYRLHEMEVLQLLCGDMTRLPQEAALHKAAWFDHIETKLNDRYRHLSWMDYGRGERGFEVDHIQPLTSARVAWERVRDLADRGLHSEAFAAITADVQLAGILHRDNLQPLSIEDHLIKSIRERGHNQRGGTFHKRRTRARKAAARKPRVSTEDAASSGLLAAMEEGMDVQSSASSAVEPALHERCWVGAVAAAESQSSGRAQREEDRNTRSRRAAETRAERERRLRADFHQQLDWQRLVKDVGFNGSMTPTAAARLLPEVERLWREQWEAWAAVQQIVLMDQLPIHDAQHRFAFAQVRDYRALYHLDRMRPRAGGGGQGMTFEQVAHLIQRYRRQDARPPRSAADAHSTDLAHIMNGLRRHRDMQNHNPYAIALLRQPLPPQPPVVGRQRKGIVGRGGKGGGRGGGRGGRGGGRGGVVACGKENRGRERGVGLLSDAGRQVGKPRGAPLAGSKARSAPPSTASAAAEGRARATADRKLPMRTPLTTPTARTTNITPPLPSSRPTADLNPQQSTKMEDV